MATKGKVLVSLVLRAGRGLPLKDGKVYIGRRPTILNELTVPVRALMKAGLRNHLRQPYKGNTPQVDVHSEVADFFGAGTRPSLRTICHSATA